MRTGTLDIVVGGQYGSEGKGAVAAALARRNTYDVLIRVAGPNAGHTVIDHNGTPRALRQIPAAGIVDHLADLYIAPGSEVDLRVLADDIATYEAAGVEVRSRLYVSPEATLIEPAHIAVESHDSFGQHGSTRKGIGAARSDRLMRRALRVQDASSQIEDLGVSVEDAPDAEEAMIEGCQGYWLGSHAGFYPYCTSSDCRAVDFLAMSGVTQYRRATPWVVFRSFPIRIAGNSGPLESETTWDEIGVPAEFTTVTKKMRRVGRWEPRRAEQALQANFLGGAHPNIAMTFMDYLSKDVDEQITYAIRMLGGASRWLVYVGNGPSSGVWV